MSNSNIINKTIYENDGNLRTGKKKQKIGYWQYTREKLLIIIRKGHIMQFLHPSLLHFNHLISLLVCWKETPKFQFEILHHISWSDSAQIPFSIYTIIENSVIDRIFTVFPFIFFFLKKNLFLCVYFSQCVFDAGSPMRFIAHFSYINNPAPPFIFPRSTRLAELCNWNPFENFSYTWRKRNSSIDIVPAFAVEWPIKQ